METLSPALDEAGLASALAGDPDAFRELTDKYRRGLHVHCYRMLGSFHDAEDGVQETLLQAWRHLATFAGRGSFRAWLYRIATNVCLKQRSRLRVVGVGGGDLPALPRTLDGILYSDEPALHLSPYPDSLLDDLEAPTGDPVAAYDLRDSVQLAFLAALQLLPPRQRAVLILRDVVGFPSKTVAEMLESTTASVNSALNRARYSLEQQRAAGRFDTGHALTPGDVEWSLVQTYVDAWYAADLPRLAGLLTNDVVLTMPPRPVRYSGREAVAAFLASIRPPDQRMGFRFVPTRANRQPALAVYRLDRDISAYHGWAIWVLGVDGAALAEITAFADPRLMPAFGLPTSLPPQSRLEVAKKAVPPTEHFRLDSGS
jgi:RNA polymerase sigma-70 factor (ECF subfamily)